MVYVKGPFIYAVSFVNSLTAGKDDSEKTDYLFDFLLKEIENHGGCLEDVIAVQKFVAKNYDNSITKDTYSKYFKSIKPSYTVVTMDNLLECGGDAEDTCRIMVVAVKGCSKGEMFNGKPLDRITYASGSPLEEIMGYSRAVKAGPFVLVGGTTSVLPDKTVYGNGNSKMQDEFIWKKITDFAFKAGAKEADIVKVKKFVTPQYRSSGVLMPSENCSAPLTQTVSVQKLTREGQLEEVELFAVAGSSSDKDLRECVSYFDLF